MIGWTEKEVDLADLDPEKGRNVRRRPARLKVIGSAGKGISRPAVVLVDGNRRAFLKNTAAIDDSDDLELVLSQIGRCVGVKMAEEYRVLAKNGEKIGLLSLDVARDGQDTFLEMREIPRKVLKEVQEKRLPAAAWMEEWMEAMAHPAFPGLEENREFRCRSDEDCRAAVLLPLRCRNLLRPGRKEERETFRREYLTMLLFDLLTGQTDRTADNYGILCRKEGIWELAPLFDNATLQKPYLAWEQYSLNGMILDRAQLCRVLAREFGGEIALLAEEMLGRYEEKKEDFWYQAEHWIENEGKEILKKRLGQGAGWLARLCGAGSGGSAR